MITIIEKKSQIPTVDLINKTSHSVFVVDEEQKKFPLKDVLTNKLKRIGKKINDLKKTPVVTELAGGGIICWVMASDNINLFQCHTLLRKSLALIINEKPTDISIMLQAEGKLSKLWGEAAVYVTLLNTQSLPSHKKDNKNVPLKKLTLYGVDPLIDLNAISASVVGNTLTRELTITPPNELTPTIYKNKIKKLAKQNKWKLQEYSMSKLKKMGFRGSQTSELFFENFKVPAKNILGEEGKGHITVMNGLDSERAMIAPICLGISERALEISVEYAKIREQFGKPISSFQMIQSKLADMYTMVQSIRALVYSVLAECDNTDKKEFGRGKIHMNTAASVMYASTTCNKILDETLQIHGGMGYMWESEANRLYRSSKLLDIGAGTTEVRKMIISKVLLNQ